MNKTSSSKLDRTLAKTTWPPILLLAAIFIVATGYILYEERQKSWTHREMDLSQSIAAQEKSFADEIYLSQGEAVQFRMNSILQGWRQACPNAHACIRIIPTDSNQNSKTFTACSFDSDRWEEAKAPIFSRVIQVGFKPIAQIEYFVTRSTRLSDVFPPLLLMAILLGSLAAWLLHRVLVKNLRRNILSPLLDRVAKDERNAIIAQTTQMLAHDVMKPLSMMQFALSALKRVKGDEEFKIRQAELVPDVESTLIKVRGMLTDIVGLGAEGGAAMEETAIKPLIRETLVSIFRIYRHATVTIRYDLTHTHTVIADAKKILRVMANLTENAVQAMGEAGQLWYRTRETNVQGQRFVEFAIGNSGSFIPREEVENVFEPFYTTRKGGTGLGLAIAKKIVNEHGGRIWCSSSKDEGTEFYFTLPMGSRIDDATLDLPVHSHQVAAYRRSSSAKPPIDSSNVIPLRAGTEDAIGAGVTHILLFDDDQLVHDVWDINAKAERIPTLLHFNSWEDFISGDGHALVRQSMAFVDLSFKGSKFDGLDIARNLREIGIRRIYAITGDEARASASGLFDGVLGKGVPPDIRKLMF
jgi:signal transduction histidine kinase